MKPHQILGVSIIASPNEIKNAYKFLSSYYNPSKNSDGEKMYLKIREAYFKMIYNSQLDCKLNHMTIKNRYARSDDLTKVHKLDFSGGRLSSTIYHPEVLKKYKLPKI